MTLFTRTRAAGALVAALSLGAVAGAANAQTQFDNMSDADRAALRAEIRAYLLEEPQLLTDMAQALEDRRFAQGMEQLHAAIDAGEFVADFGPADAEVLMVEFTDYECPACRAARPELATFLAAHPEIRYVAFALPTAGTDMPERVAIAASLQDTALSTELHKAMMGYNLNGRYDLQTVMTLAAAVGLDTDRLRTDMVGMDMRERLLQTAAIFDGVGFSGTPGFIIGDQTIPGAVPAAEMEATLARYRASQAQ